MTRTADPTPKFPIRWTRRTAMLSGAAAVAALLAGGFAARRFIQKDGLTLAIMDVVRQLFGADIAAESELRSFAEHYLTHRPVREKLARAYSGAPVFFDIVQWSNLGGLGVKFDELEDSVGTAFLRNTNMLYREPDEPVVFAEEPPMTFMSCRNRLAQFDFDD